MVGARNESTVVLAGESIVLTSLTDVSPPASDVVDSPTCSGDSRDVWTEDAIMPEPQTIHIHLTPQPGTTVHVTIAGENITVASDNPEADTEPHAPAMSPDDALEEAIRRLESSGISPHVREAADGLLALGYTLRRPKTRLDKRPENYLRIMDPTYTAHGVGYLTPSAFSFSRMSDRESLTKMPGAEPISTAVNFSHVQSAQPGLDAARMLKG